MGGQFPHRLPAVLEFMSSLSGVSYTVRNIDLARTQIQTYLAVSFSASDYDTVAILSIFTKL